MIRGEVRPNRRAMVAVELLAADGQFQSFNFILDTGFDGDLSLPTQILQGLDVAAEGERIIELADGSRTTTYEWSGTVRWDDARRPVMIMESAGEPLLGMELLWQSRITLETRAYGPVVIEPLG